MASDDTITIDCVESHATAVFRELMVMKEKRRWTDFLINIEKTSLPCHRNIICANSRMIRELLEDEEMPAAAKDAINLDHFNLGTMENVLEFMYSGKISFRGDDLKEYLEVAVNLKMDNLTARCLDHVPSHITVENALGWLRLGFRRELTELINHAARVIVRHFTEIASQRDFLTLDYPQVERCLRDALTADASGREGRDNVLCSVIAWVSYDDDNRVAHLQDLINLVQPETCSSDALLNIIQTHPTIISQNSAVLVSLAAALQRVVAQNTGRQADREDRQNNPEHMGEEKKDGGDVEPADGGTQTDDGTVAQIDGAMAQVTLNVKEDGENNCDVKEVSEGEDVMKKKETQDPSTSNAAKRSKKLPVIIGGGVNNLDASPNCWVLDDSSNQFVHLSKIPVDKLGRWHSVCETDVGFSVTGGEDSDICLQYSLYTKTWSNLKKMLVTRRSHGSFFRKGVIYVIGGKVSGSKSKSVHCLDIACGDWECVLELPIALNMPRVADLNDSAYILDQDTRKLMRMDVEKKKCVELSSLPGKGACYGVSMATVNNKLCVAGTSPPICAMYEPDTDAWCEILKPNQWHAYGSLVFYQDKLLLLGGKWIPEDDDSDEDGEDEKNNEGDDHEDDEDDEGDDHEDDEDDEDDGKNGSDVVEEYIFDEGKWSTSVIKMPQESLSSHYSFVLDIPQQ